jgi:hypothetical protein
MNPLSLHHQQAMSKKWMFTHSPEIKDFWPQGTFDEVRIKPKIDWTMYEDFEQRETCDQFWPVEENKRTRRSRIKRRRWKRRQRMSWEEVGRRATEYCNKKGLMYTQFRKQMHRCRNTD